MYDSHFSATSASPTLQELSNELNLVDDWHSLGVNLGLRGYELHKIEQNYPRNNNRCKNELLDLWLRKTTKPTWEAIAKALCLMDEHVVADGIRKKYCSPSTPAGIYFLLSGYS